MSKEAEFLRRNQSQVQELSRKFEQERAAARARLEERRDSNAEYQRRKAMPTEKKFREAKDKLARNVAQFCKERGMSAAQAERKVEQLTDKFVRECEK